MEKGCLAPRPGDKGDSFLGDDSFRGGGTPTSSGALLSAFSDNPASSSPGGGRSDSIYGGNRGSAAQTPPSQGGRAWHGDPANTAMAGFTEVSGEEPEILLKIVIIGDSGVGKSSLLNRYVKHSFNAEQLTTVGVDFFNKKCQIDGTLVELQLWDTAGQERFRGIMSSYYRGAQGILVVFDVTSRKSFDSVPRWLQDVDRE